MFWRKRISFILLSLLIAGCVLVYFSLFSQAQRSTKLVIAHRGASGYLPEHTLASKALAFAQGADYLEQDIVMTKDDYLVVFHDLYLDHLTDVAERFPDRRRPDGHFYVIDFLLEEILSLKLGEGWTEMDGKKVQNYSGRFPMQYNFFRIHTLEQELAFVAGLSHSTGRPVGIYSEIKAPWFHEQEGKDINRAVLLTLKKFGYTKPSDLVFIQCFDPHALRHIRQDLFPELGMDLSLIQLIAQTDWEETQEKDQTNQWINYNYDWMFLPGAMKEIASYAQGVGPQVPMLFNIEKPHGQISASVLVKEAKEQGLLLHPYTLRKDSLPPFVSSWEELKYLVFYVAKADGVFTDFPDLINN